MPRIKQLQIIDKVILSITSVIKNRCSLPEEDLAILDEAISQLQKLKRKKGKTNKEILETVAKIVELLLKYFLKDSENNRNRIIKTDIP